MIYTLALLVGIVAGLRAVMALATISWAAAFSSLDLSPTWLAFLGYKWTPWIISIAAIGELVNDKLPGTPSRKIPPQFGARLVTGGISGAALAWPTGNWIAGLVAGLVGAVIGTLGGSKLRAVLAASLGKDLPAALVEDVLAILLAIVVVVSLR
jgi:uncharacterized membrane protein